ncbi:MAG: ATP-binding cassette domain-containing protein [Marivibrio sp.]|uniref:ATP-binding cassette domain-containing protein n=1 Tax=Marivibrio sp. TaxID=2039719 RepID=UPI0032EBBA6D
MAELIEVSAARGGRRVLHEVTLAAPAGCVTVIAGPNGSGKTTALALMAGDLRPSTGRVLLGDAPIEGLSAAVRALRRAVMPQHFNLVFAFTVREVVEMGLLPALPARRRAPVVEEALALADVAAMAERPVTQLSGGERQRVSFARATAQVLSAQAVAPDAPATLFLDEPTASLDLAHQAAVVRAAHRLAADGVRVVMVMHDLTLIDAAADHLVLLKEGQVAAAGAPRAVLDEPTIRSVYAASVAVIEDADARAVALTALRP